MMTFSHIHGLGYSKDGLRLYVPAHKGLMQYTAGKWGHAAGEEHDFMGFSVSNDGFYSSGHPAAGSKLKNPLGIVKSTDEGKTLTTLALSGETDFHGLTVGYSTHALYVLNAEPNSVMKQTGLFYSLDEAKSWKASGMGGIQGQITTLAAHSTQKPIVAMGTTTGAFVSQDYGQTFTTLYSQHAVSTMTFTQNGDLLLGLAKPNAALIRLNPDSKQTIGIKSPVQGNDSVLYLAENPVNSKEIATATENKDVFVSADGGGNWTQIVDKGKALDRK